ncbi:MAG: metal-dependent phosphohydrolase [Ilumatobacteraceae bacterium]
MSSSEAALRRCWRGLAGDGHGAIIDSIVARHREPHRRYHTAVHVMWVLHHVDDLVDAARHESVDAHVDADVVRAAALFHDAIYDPRSSTNEHDSALLAVESLRPIGWDERRLAHVATLIEATAGHTRDDTDDTDDAGADGAGALEVAVLLDADLAILGASPAEYRAYVSGVRAEYAHVAPDAWRTGRAAILRSFLDRPNIYSTPTMHTAREHLARANLAAEVLDLEGGIV